MAPLAKNHKNCYSLNVPSISRSATSSHACTSRLARVSGGDELTQ